MTAQQQAMANLARLRTMKGKRTPAEHMEYLRAKKAAGETMTAGQRGFLAASIQLSGEVVA